MIARIKKDDLVKVISGKDKGATGQVLFVDVKKERVRVKGINVITKHVKPSRHGEKGKIEKEEGFIAASNVMPVCPSTDKPCRVRSQVTQDGKRVRISSRSKEAF